ncbi:hypothetical protein V1511DRAFT_281953 [Dipodascopsis uninucleata]
MDQVSVSQIYDEIRRTAILFYQSVKPHPGASVSAYIYLYMCIIIVIGTIMTLYIYISAKVVGYMIGSRLRKQSRDLRNRIFEEFLESKGLTGDKLMAASSSGPKESPKGRPFIVGFFHPYCNAGGGGERVLWTAIHATLNTYPLAICAIYTGDIDATKDEIIERAMTRFEISVDSSRITMVYLKKRYLVASETWPHFTLLGQALGSIPLTYEAMSQLVPDIYIDTMGYAFSYPLVSLALSIPVGAYVHYPMISSDMLSKVPIWRHPIKNIYWRIFSFYYAFSGAFADVVMANSTWTFNHIRNEWWINRLMDKMFERSEKLQFRIVYPPCNTRELSTCDVESPRQPIALSIAQFRPEKRHQIIIDEFAKFIKKPGVDEKIKLVLIGSVRDDRDKKRVYELRLQVRELDIADRVEFLLEAHWDIVKQYLQSSSVGINGMWNEHFGIGVVEYLASGLITVAHNSGGPKLDIVVPVDGQPTGFHFTTEGDESTSLAAYLGQAFSMEQEEAVKYRKAAKISAARFSEEEFEKAWIERLRILIMLEQFRRVDRISRGLSF